MSLIDEIQAKCPPELIAAKEHGQIAELVSQGRTRLNTTLIGFGTIIDALGLVDGPAALDTLDALRVSSPAIKWAWTLLEQGRLDIALDSTRQQVVSLQAAGVLTAEQRDKLLALAIIPAPVSVTEVIEAMRGL